MTTIEKIKAEIEQTADEEQKHDEKWTMGLRYAIKIIDKYAEQEPCDDAVSRQNIIDTYESCADMLSDEELEDANLVMEWIYKAPSVNLQEQQTGHWILQPSNKEQGERDFIWWKCSECGQVIYSETEKDRREYHAFCGKCGCRMVEPQEREG